MNKFLAVVFIGGIILYLTLQGFVLAPLFVIFAFGTIGFYSLAALATFVLCFYLEAEEENFLPATITFLLFILAVNYLGENQLFEAIKRNPIYALYTLAGCLALAVTWSYGKWKRFCVSHNDRWLKLKEKFLKEHQITTAALTSNRDLLNKLKEEARSKGIEVPPLARNHKRRITAWACYFPWSMLATLVNDPIRRTVTYIVTKLQGLYQKIADSSFTAEDRELMKR